MTIVHQTPGLIDLMAFTTFGVNSKPNAKNPIGYFGTGLKYAIAVLCREGCEVTVWIGQEPHVFYGEKVIFRDKEFIQLRMKRKRGITARWMSQELPFTTELGKNWQLWMAFRELHSNTVDENGDTFQTFVNDGGIDGRTRICVEGDAYRKVFEEMSDIFLPGLSDAEVFNLTHTQVTRRPGRTEHGFYRGMRAHTLQHPAMFTWDVQGSLSLTEDRTIQHGFMFDWYVARHVVGLTDKNLIRRIIEAPNDTFEAGLKFDDENYCVSPQFIETARLYGKRQSTVVVVERDRARHETRAESDWRVDLRIVLQSDKTDAELGAAIRLFKHHLLLFLKAELIKDKIETEEIPF